MTNPLDDMLQRYGIASTTSRRLFQDKATLLDLPKNQDIFREGQKNGSEYLLLSGVVHRYNSSEKGDRVTTGFYLANAVITPHFARTNEGKSLFSLQSLTGALLAEIPVHEFDALRHTHPEFGRFGQRIIEAELARTFYNEVVFRSFSAKERLLAMRQQYPNLENRVPHSVIASYLGITNVSFSRLRHELARD